MALQTPHTPPGPLKLSGQQSSPPSRATLPVDKGKKPLYQNRSWVRGRDPEPVEDEPDGSETGCRPSLLSRLESPSLLKRIAPPGEASAAPSLADRLTEPPEEFGEGMESYEDMEMREVGLSVSNEVRVKLEETMVIIPSPTSERRVGKARGSRSTIDVFGEPMVPTPASEPPDLAQDHPEEWEEEAEDEEGEEGGEEDPPLPKPLPVSDTDVDALLADIVPPGGPIQSDRLPPSEVPSSLPGRRDGEVTITARSSIPAEPAPHRTSSLPPPHILEKARALLLPSLIQLALRRNPGLDEKTARERVSARFSDDQCTELIELAKRMRQQLQERESSARSQSVLSDVGSRLGSKRPRDGDDDPGQPTLKIPRVASPAHMDDGRLAAKIATSRRSATPTASYHDPALGPRGGSSVAKSASETSMDAAPQDFVPAASRGRSTTPTSRAPMMSTSSTPRPSRHSSLKRSQTPPREERTAPPADPILSTASQEPCERAISANPSFPPSTISPCATPPVSLHSPTSAEAQDTIVSRSPNTSHHASITRRPRSNTRDPSEDYSSSQDAMQGQQDHQGQTAQEPSPTLVPAIWAAPVGKPSPDIEEVEFFVDDVTADATQHWARRKETFSFEHRHVKVHLLCLSTASVSEFYETLSPTASREEIVAAMWNMENEWPPRGTLVIDTSPDHPGFAWVPGEDTGSLDITPAIRSGTNKFRLIQLADMSSKLFVFLAAEPSDGERKAVGSKTIGWARALDKLAPHSPKGRHTPVAARTPFAA